MYPDGTLVSGPKALCELQGYVYDAWLRMAEIYDELDNKRRASALRKKAAALFEKFNETFWDEDFGLLCLRFGRSKEKGTVGSIQCRAMFMVWHHRAGTCRPCRETPDAQRHVERLGHPHAVGKSSLV